MAAEDANMIPVVIKGRLRLNNTNDVDIDSVDRDTLLDNLVEAIDNADVYVSVEDEVDEGEDVEASFVLIIEDADEVTEE